jgi:uncharacterized membrane protein YeaQ/YmgE (transglycosylase-associated protein family)
VESDRELRGRTVVVLTLILLLALCGLIVGALGRLLVPGPNPIGILRTILVGIAGSFLGGLVGHLVFGWRYRYSGLFGFVLAVVFTALIVYAIDGRARRSAVGPRRSTCH